MTKRFVVCEPGVGGGILQGDCLGFVFCYNGRKSQYPSAGPGDILYFDTRESAQACIDFYVKSAIENKTGSEKIFQAMWIVEVDDETDLEALTQQAVNTSICGAN